MIKNKNRLAIKLFIIVWVVLVVHIALKLTFNYWQPYVIPNDRLQVISDFIDDNSIIKIALNGVLYFINGYIMICCGLQKWQLDKKINIITTILLLVGFICVAFVETTIVTLFLSLIYPLILNYKKWKYVILTFIFNNVFMILSLWLEGFVNTDNMQYICKVFYNLTIT